MTTKLPPATELVKQLQEAAPYLPSLSDRILVQDAACRIEKAYEALDGIDDYSEADWMAACIGDAQRALQGKD